MRDYAKVSPQFWIGTTGKALRAAGPEAQIVALYLLTTPHANMLGLFYLPKLFIAHETGLPIEGASRGLQSSINAHFCSYDAQTEVVWVHEMAAYQVGEQLSENDKRCIGIQNEYDSLPENPFLRGFFDRYSGAFHMRKFRGFASKTPSPSEAPSEVHRSQEHEQEHETEQEQEQENPSASATPTRKTVPRESSPEESGWFLDFKLAYPHRAGDQGWRKALRAANARIGEEHTPQEFLAGARRYAEFCEATGKTGTEFVKQACTFLGPDKPFLLPWHAPPKPENASERILKHLNGTDNSRVIEHEPDEQTFLPSY